MLNRDTFQLVIQHLPTTSICRLAATQRRFHSYWAHTLQSFARTFFSQFPELLKSMEVMAQLWAESRLEFHPARKTFLPLPTYDSVSITYMHWANRIILPPPHPNNPLAPFDMDWFRRAIRTVIMWGVNPYRRILQRKRAITNRYRTIQALFRGSADLRAGVTKQHDNGTPSSLYDVLRRDANDWFLPEPSVSVYDAHRLLTLCFPLIPEEKHEAIAPHLQHALLHSEFHSYGHLARYLRNLQAEVGHRSKRARNILSIAVGSSSSKRQRKK